MNSSTPKRSPVLVEQEGPPLEFSGDEVPEPRSHKQQIAYRALFGEGGLLSWERVLASATAANRPGIIRNALHELFPLAERAGVSHSELSDWATNQGAIYDL